jgi:type VI secretion system protein ImpF
MPAPTRLKPSLLDRLTDAHPERSVESYEASNLDSDQLKECVRRDLAWLLNTTHLAAVRPLADFPEVRRSVLNYGIPDLAGKTLSGLDRNQLERALRDVLWEYEPRLLRKSVRLRVATEKKEFSHNAIVFYVEAELWSEPVPLPLYLRTEIDLEDGTVNVEEIDGGGS